MRVLTLQEPWASLIGEGIKLSKQGAGPVINLENYTFTQVLLKSNQLTLEKELSSWLAGPLHYGTIFAKCNLIDCIKITEEFANYVREMNPRCYLCGDYTPGRYAWILSDIEPISPIQKSGKLGIWYYNSN